MGDVGDDYNAMKQHKKETRAKRLDSACSDGWEKFSDHHWHRTVKGSRMDYWPSTTMVIFRGKRMNINSKQVQALIKPPEPGQ